MSVVVCSYNGAATLPDCLAALAGQTLPGAEVILVDDGSHDATSAIGAAYGVRVVRHPRNRGLAAARNTGVVHSRATLVAFTDDDCVPPPDWLEQLTRPLRGDRERPAVGGAVHPLQVDSMVRRYIAAHNPLAPLELDLRDDQSAAQRLARYLRARWQAPARRGPRPVYSLVGANMAFRRSALHAVGLFDQRIRFGGEEEDLCRRLRRQLGERCVLFDPRATVAHNYPSSPRDLLRRRWAYGRGNARTFCKNGGRVPPVPPFALISVAAAGFALSGRWTRLPALAVPVLLYGRAAGVRPGAGGESLAHAGLAFLEEVCTFAGFLEGWARHRHEYRDAR